MTREERCKLALAVMEEETIEITDKLRELGQAVLDEVLRLETEGDAEEAKRFEAFIPIDENYLNFLAPLIGEEELKNVLIEYREQKKELREEYIRQCQSI